MNSDVKSEKQLKLPENKKNANSNWVTEIIQRPGETIKVKRSKRQPGKK